MRPLHHVAALITVFVWGLNFSVAKIGVGQVPPILLMAMRLTLVAILLAGFLRPPGKALPHIVGLSVTMGGLHYSLMYTGLKGVDAGAAAIAFQLMVPFSAALAAFFFRERLSVLQMLGMAIAFGGVYLLSGEPRIAVNPLSFLMVVGGALMWAIGNIQVKQMGPIDVMALNAWVSLLGAPQLFIASFLLEDGQLGALASADWRGWGALLYMVLGATILAHGLWYHLLRENSVNRVAPFSLLVPVMAVLLAIPILGETLTLRLVIGGALTIVGVATIQFTRMPKQAAA
ncbi:MAG: DMT family transporter [Acidiferrobacterales bacterium]